MKRILTILLCATVVLMCCTTVYAHQGRTDGSGGHTDSDTGEYHYHHGYPAHDHYDIDCDGDIDCPYDFDDQTGSNNGRSSSNSNYAKGNKDINNTMSGSVPENETEELSVPTWVYWVIAVLTASVVILFFIVKSKSKELIDQEKRFRQDAIDEESRVRAGIFMLHNAIVKKFGKDYLYMISGAPSGDFVDEKLLPHSVDYPVNRYCDNYTFFLGSTPYNYKAKYHHSSCKYAKGVYPVNAYTLRKHKEYQSCTLCPCRLPDTTWVDEYIKHYAFLKKYVDVQNSRQPSAIADKGSSHRGVDIPRDPSLKINWRDQ